MIKHFNAFVFESAQLNKYCSLIHQLMESPNYVTFPGLYQNKAYLIKDEPTYPVVIILSDSTSVYMDDANRELLAKILQSVNIALPKAKVINVQNLDDSLQQPIPLPARAVISFGVDFASIGQNLNPEPYQAQPHEDKVYLKADSLHEIAQDKQKKISLWQALKAMFTDK